ncbi:MAG: hypothetical protein CMA12_01890 [Euryarchaeota archaeon]|nr:hypothetical protein [Euryarchaeota archaeon]OUW22985.1 MAG: hypothetical protein CBD33_00465 [Euryarchaeota archaeon TMED173]|tara:strand:- start:277 stop:669 length:393 start_codon:yes stop_codon:yes gene_type:complete
MLPSYNVLGTNLQTCSENPLTGWFRDGCCNTDRTDSGLHTVCCIVTNEFLEFARSRGNDLISPAPQFGFPGLAHGDKWCVCARTWKDAADSDLACPVILEATHEESLQVIPIDLLREYAWKEEHNSETIS